MRAEVAAFEIASRKTSNGDFLEFVQGGGYEDEKLWTEAGWKFIRASKIKAPPFWRHRDGEWLYDGLFESMPLPLEWPVYVSHIEALAFTRWCSCRLPSESEWHRAFDAQKLRSRTTTTSTLSHGIPRRCPRAMANFCSWQATVGNGRARPSPAFLGSSPSRITQDIRRIFLTDCISFSKGPLRLLPRRGAQEFSQLVSGSLSLCLYRLPLRARSLTRRSRKWCARDWSLAQAASARLLLRRARLGVVRCHHAAARVYDHAR